MTLFIMKKTDMHHFQDSMKRLNVNYSVVAEYAVQSYTSLGYEVVSFFDDADTCWAEWDRLVTEETLKRREALSGDYLDYLTNYPSVTELGHRVFRLGGRADFEIDGRKHTLLKKVGKPLVEVVDDAECFILNGFNRKQLSITGLACELLGMDEEENE